ncbi:MAG: hypothetical protein KIT45_09970 [Fimbriimonadia bacterium]|nr:hypothetical protein [Fimbriimonadia bacterium]
MAGGHPNVYLYCANDPINGKDPSGLGGDGYWKDVGKVFKGYWIVGTHGAIWNWPTRLSEAKQLAVYVASSGLTLATAQTLLSAQWCYFWDGLSGTDPERFGESFGLVLISSASIGVGSMVSGAGGATAGLSGSIARAPVTFIKFSTKSLQHSISRGHGPDFGVQGNWSKAAGQALQSAITKHCSAPGTTQIKGYYRGKPALFYTNPQTGLTAIFDMQGHYMSGWKFSATQLQYLLTTGRVN